jgi:hypothetical protein
MLVSEIQIDAVADFFEETDYEEEVVKLSERQPHLAAYIFSEDFELLMQTERELMLFILLVVVNSVEKALEEAGMLPLEEVSAEELEDAEEANWERIENIDAKKFRERLDVFFNTSPEEDLLAFVEDMLADDDDDEAEPLVSKEGREPIFIALKSVIDVLVA